MKKEGEVKEREGREEEEKGTEAREKCEAQGSQGPPPLTTSQNTDKNY